MARQQWGSKKPLDGPLVVELIFFLKKPKSVNRDYPCVKPDIDNLAKAIKDACEGVCWLNDSQIVDCVLKKRYASDGEAFTHMTVKEKIIFHT